MPRKGPAPRYKPRRSEGYALCRRLYGVEMCSCERRGNGPCDALLPALHAARGNLDEATRIASNRDEWIGGLLAGGPANGD